MQVIVLFIFVAILAAIAVYMGYLNRDVVKTEEKIPADVNFDDKATDVAKPKICSRCGTQLSEEQLYCPKCGKKSSLIKKTPKNTTLLAVVAVLVLVFTLVLIAFCGREKPKITVSEEFYEYAIDTIETVESYLSYHRGYSYEYLYYALADIDSPQLPPVGSIDKKIRDKEREIWLETLGIHTYVTFHEENPNTRESLKKLVNELKAILEGVVVGEVFIDESQAAP